jgi:pimeloyl-ACP methyl ester carboxylesterase
MNPIDPPASMNEPAQDLVLVASKPPLWKRAGRFLVLRVVVYYVLICVGVMFLQRQLIYHPQRVERITSAQSPLSAGCLHDFAFETEDGLTLRGWHVLRTGARCDTPEETQRILEEGRWLVLFFHGNAGDRRGRVDYSLIFNGAGADVFVIDYRGYADNPGSPSEKGLLKDARALWKYATETCRVDPSRILLFGESLGGGVAVSLAQEVCNAGTPPAGLVLQSTFSSLADAAHVHYPWLPVRFLLWDRYSSEDRIGDVTSPVLVLHGTEDRIVPYELGERLFAAAPPLSANHTPKQFVPLQGGDHNGLLLSHRRQISEAIEEFLTKLPKPRGT